MNKHGRGTATNQGGGSSTTITTEELLAECMARLQAQEVEINNLKSAKGTSSADAFAEHLREEGAYKRDAWKADLDNARAYFDEAAADYKANPDAANARLQKAFHEQCTAGMLGPMDVMVLTYLFWASDEGRYNLAAAFLDADTPIKRVQYHNWYLAKEMPAQRLRFVGPAIKDLRYPLFPETSTAQEFAVLNRRLLAEVGANPAGQLFGRGPGTSTKQSVYAKQGSTDPGIPPEGRTVFGAGGYSVRVDAEGYVDLSAADAAMREAQNRITALEKALIAAGIELPLAPQGRGRVM